MGWVFLILKSSLWSLGFCKLPKKGNGKVLSDLGGGIELYE
jgi:hypothetical protein